MADLNAGCLRFFDIGHGAHGYDASTHLFSNNVDNNGLYYIDLIARRHHMRWGELAEDTRPKDFGRLGIVLLFGGALPCFKMVWVYSTPYRNGCYHSNALLVLRAKGQDSFGIPLLQACMKCGGRRRNSMETEWDHRGNGELEYEVGPTSLSCGLRPFNPLQFTEGRPAPAHLLSRRLYWGDGGVPF